MGTGGDPGVVYAALLLTGSDADALGPGALAAGSLPEIGLGCAAGNVKGIGMMPGSRLGRELTGCAFSSPIGGATYEPEPGSPSRVDADDIQSSAARSAPTTPAPPRALNGSISHLFSSSSSRSRSWSVSWSSSGGSDKNGASEIGSEAAGTGKIGAGTGSGGRRSSNSSKGAGSLTLGTSLGLRPNKGSPFFALPLSGNSARTAAV